jgi:predicted DNA-binding transcriptional regulator YafY
MDHLLAGVQPRLLEPHIAPLRARVRGLLDTGDYAPEAIRARIRILNVWTRPVEPRHFEMVASATLDRRRLALTHFHRKRNETLQRQVSPQRLVHYRGNWYLDAWCHLRDGLRSFALDAIEAVQALPEPARDVEPEALTTFFDAGYGVFSGPETKTAVLRFTPTRARWVAQEIWHPRQQSAWDEAGHYILRVPYADETELLMDILRHGPDVEVLSPEGLRAHVRSALEAALAGYGEAEAGLTG